LQQDASKVTTVEVPDRDDYRYGTEVRLSGRVVSCSTVRQVVFVKIDARRSRFHPASIAGIVVGAMGVFIFGLYLRRWVKERRAGDEADGRSSGTSGREY